MLSTARKIFQDDQSLDGVNLGYFTLPLNQGVLKSKINLFFNAIETGEKIDSKGLCNGITTLLLEADIRNGEAALVKHLLLRKFLAEADDETIKKMGKWYKFKLNAIEHAQSDLQATLSKIKDPAQAKIIRKVHHEKIENEICENKEFIPDFSDIGTPQNILVLINRIYNFAHVVTSAHLFPLSFYVIEDEYKDNGESITNHRIIAPTDTTQLIKLLSPPQDAANEEKDEVLDDKNKDEKRENKNKEKNLLQAKMAFRFSFSLTQDELASVLEQVLHEGDRARLNSLFPNKSGHSVYLRVVRNAEGCLEYQYFNDNSSYRFFRSFNSCEELARVLKYDVYYEQENMYLPLDLQVFETVDRPDRPTIEMVLDDLLQTRGDHPNLNQKSRDGASALFVAAMSGNCAVVDYLLKKGAAVDSASLVKAHDRYIYNKLKSQQSLFKRNWKYIAVAALIGGVCATGIGALCLGVSAVLFAFAVCGTLVSASVAAYKKSKDEFNSRAVYLTLKTTKKPISDVQINPQCRSESPKKISTKMRKTVEIKNADDIFADIQITSIASIEQTKIVAKTMWVRIAQNERQISDTYKKKSIDSIYKFVWSLDNDLKKYSTMDLASVNILKTILQFAISAYRNILTATNEYSANNFVGDFLDDVGGLLDCAKKSNSRFFADPFFNNIVFAIQLSLAQSQLKRPPMQQLETPSSINITLTC